MQFITANHHSVDEHHHIECLQLGYLFVCMSKSNEWTGLQKTLFRVFGSEAPEGGYSGVAHLIYDKGQEDFADELKRCGYAVEEREFFLPIDEDTFNVLDLACYKAAQGEIFVFKDLAVRNNGDELEMFYKTRMTLSDITAHWALEDDLDESTLAYKHKVPKDPIGTLAMKVEHLSFQSWDNLFRCPGETIDSEERLQMISDCYAHLANGGNLGDFLGQVEENLQAIIDMYSTDELADYSEENRIYYEHQVEQAKSFLKCASELSDESKGRAVSCGDAAIYPENEHPSFRLELGGM